MAELPSQAKGRARFEVQVSEQCSEGWLSCAAAVVAPAGSCPVCPCVSPQWLQQIEVTESALQQKMLDLENEKVPGRGSRGWGWALGSLTALPCPPGAVQQAEGIPGR